MFAPTGDALLHDSSGGGEPLGTVLLEAATKTTSEALLVSPFVKASVLERLLSCVVASVAVTVVTRWRPDEIARGVSDLGIWEVLQNRVQGRLLLEPALHAKYYRFDEHAFIGSANLTASALGWKMPANVELLEVSRPLVAFEERLLRRAISATEDLRDVMADAASVIDIDGGLRHDVEAGLDEDARRTWIPKIRNPEDLYLAYSDRSVELGAASRNAARADLLALEVGRGLEREAFRVTVGALLLTMPYVARLDEFVEETRRFGEVRDWLAEELSLSRHEATITWQTLMRWLLYFLPSRYERTRPHYSEGFRRIGA